MSLWFPGAQVLGSSDDEDGRRGSPNLARRVRTAWPVWGPSSPCPMPLPSTHSTHPRSTSILGRPWVDRGLRGGMGWCANQTPSPQGRRRPGMNVAVTSPWTKPSNNGGRGNGRRRSSRPMLDYMVVVVLQRRTRRIERKRNFTCFKTMERKKCMVLCSFINKGSSQGSKGVFWLRRFTCRRGSIEVEPDTTQK